MDFLPALDPWIGAILFFSAAAPLLSRLVGSEIGAPRSSFRTPIVVCATLIALWCGVRYLLHSRAAALLESRIYEQRPPRRVAAVPDLWNPTLFRGFVETPALTKELRIDLLGTFDPEAGETYYPPAERRAVELFEKTPEARRARMSWPVTEVIPVEKAWEVTRRDLRTGEEVRAIVPR